MIQLFDLADGAMVPATSLDPAIQVFVNPDAAERDLLRTGFGLDEHTLSSALDPDEVPRVELAPGRVLLIWKRPTSYSGRDTFYFDVASIGILLLERRMAVIVTDTLPLTSGARHVPAFHRPADVLLGLLAHTIQHYLEHLKVIKMIARDLQQKINTSMENKHLIQMFNLSESLIYYLNAINSNGVALARLRVHAEKTGFSTADLEFLDDLVIENDQCFKQAEIYSTVLSGLMDARGSLVNNNMNQLLKNLTRINVVFLPLNLIAGIGGMSEYSMMTSGINWRIAYLGFAVAMIVIGLITATALRRMDFGGSPRDASRRGGGEPPGAGR